MTKDATVKSSSIYTTVAFGNLLLLIVGLTSIMAWRLSNIREQLGKIETTFDEVRLIGINRDLAYSTAVSLLKDRAEILEARADILETATDVGEQRQTKIDIAMAAIIATLPRMGNPLKECRFKPTSGEIRRIAGYVVKFADDYAVKPSTVMGILRQESVFCNSAISPVGARGYMQMMPKTAIEVAVDLGLPLKIRRGKDNIHMGTAYISTLLTAFNGDTNLAVRAYNGGPDHVKRVLAGRTEAKDCKDKEGNFLFTTNYYCETEGYARKVLEFKDEYIKLGLL